MTKLISINDAVKLGIERLRKPTWIEPVDHIKIDIIDGQLGPRIHSFSPDNKIFNGKDPIDIFTITDRFRPDDKAFVAYDGPLPDSDEYRAAIARLEDYMADWMD